MTTILRRAFKATLWLALIGLAAVGALYLWLQYAPREVPRGQPALVRLTPTSLSAVRTAFNAGRGEVRVLAMLSPT